MKQNALAQPSFFLKQFDASISHELVIRALNKLADMRDASFYFQKGEEHRLKNEFALAISYYEKALKINNKHKDSLFFLGWCYLGITDRITGEEIPDDVQISVDERYKRAELAYKKLISILRKESEGSFYMCAAYYNYSIALSLQDKGNEALDCCYHAIQIRENYAPAYRRLAYIKLNMGLYTEALKDCERAIELNIELERSYNALGLIYSAMGNKEEAIESYLMAIDCNPQFIFPYVNLNEEYVHQKLYFQAIEIMNNAIAENPEYADFYYFHALTDDEMENETDAAIYYGRFLKKAPAKSERFAKHIKHAHKRLQKLQKPLT